MDKRTALKFMRLFYKLGYNVRWTRYGCEIPLPCPLPKNIMRLESQSLSVVIYPDVNSWEVFFNDNLGMKGYVYRTDGSDATLLEVIEVAESGVVYSYVPYPR